MRQLRKQKDSLLSLLESFVYEPLVNWKLDMDESNPEPDDTHMQVLGQDFLDFQQTAGGCV